MNIMLDYVLTKNASLQEEKAKRIANIQWSAEIVHRPEVWCRLSTMQEY